MPILSPLSMPVVIELSCGRISALTGIRNYPCWDGKRQEDDCEDLGALVYVFSRKFI